MKLGGRPKIIYTLYTVLGFGKHKGKTIQSVIQSDPKWLNWAIEEDIIKLNNEAFKLFTESYVPDLDDFRDFDYIPQDIY